MRRFLLAVVLGILVAKAAPLCFAEETTQWKAAELRSVSITISPVHLFLPVVEATVEGRIGPRAGVAGIAGYGAISSGSNDFTVIEGGGQLNYYLLGDFDDGMQIGVEALYTKLDGGDGSVTGFGNGLAVGPYVGYKTTTDGGFTFNAQLGAEYLAISASASESDTGDSASASETAVIALLNLNIGWSM